MQLGQTDLRDATSDNKMERCNTYILNANYFPARSFKIGRHSKISRNRDVASEKPLRTYAENRIRLISFFQIQTELS